MTELITTLKTKKKIMQLMPIPFGLSYRPNVKTKNGVVSCRLVGAALMEDGMILPVIWDEKLSFCVMDQGAQAGIRALAEALGEMNFDRMCREAEEKTSAEPSDPEADKMLEDMERQAFRSYVNGSGASSSDYWDELTAGDYPGKGREQWEE